MGHQRKGQSQMSKDKPLCALDGCDKPARRKFCCNDHKDKFHNRNNPRGYGARSNHHPRDIEEIDDNIDDNIGHIFQSGYFGHGQD